MTYSPSFTSTLDNGLRLGNIQAIVESLINANAFSTSYGITALGTSQSTATQLTSVINQIDTVSTSTGVNLPLSTGRIKTPFKFCIIINNGANSVHVYAAQNSNDTIDGVSGITGISQPAGTIALYVSAKAGAWFQLTSGPASGGVRTATFVIAASNSTNKSQADYICTGTNDDVVINAALAALPTFGQQGARAGKVLLRAGTYNLGASIIIDGDYTTLEGENFPMWGGYNTNWTSTSAPAGAIGTGPATIKASSTGFDLIQIQNNNVPSGTGANSEDQYRHRGICIRNLYLIGDGYTAQGISTDYNGSPSAFPTDFSLIENCVIQRCTNGINVNVDSWVIKNNSIQDNSGIGIGISGTNGTVKDNLIWDIGGSAILASSGCIIESNTIGDISGGRAILAEAGGTIINGNLLVNISQVGIWTTSPGMVISNNVINIVSSSNNSAIYTNGTGNHSITGNTITQTGSSGPYAAIGVGSGTGNVISGNAMTGAWGGGTGQIGASSATALAANSIWHNEPYATLNGTTAGTVVSSQSLQGNSKKFVALFSGYENDTVTSQTITYTIPFINIPTITVNDVSNSQLVSTTATTLTITTLDSTATSSGTVIVEGQ